MTADLSLANLSRHSLISISADLSVSQALAIAHTERVHHFPVTRHDTLVGISCTCDLHAAPPDARVSAVMKTPVVAIDRTANLLDAISTMNAHDIGSVLLMNGSQACGVLTRADVVFSDPTLGALFSESRADCSGVTRHLSATADGYTLCMHCLEPRHRGSDWVGPITTRHMSRDGD
jgi:signal-transduction protein with cAMP-binding, CBS, and nucleotidyltransferase domain